MAFSIGDMKDQVIRRVLRKLNNMVGQNMSGVDYKEELYNPTGQALATTIEGNVGLLRPYFANSYI